MDARERRAATTRRYFRPATICRAAVEVFGASGEVHLPVVEDARTMRRLLGCCHEHEVMLSYHRAMQQARGEERGEL